MLVDPSQDLPQFQACRGEKQLTRVVAWQVIVLSVLTIAFLLAHATELALSIERWQVLVSRLGFVLLCVIALLLCRRGQTRVAAQIMLWGN